MSFNRVQKRSRAKVPVLFFSLRWSLEFHQQSCTAAELAVAPFVVNTGLTVFPETGFDRRSRTDAERFATTHWSVVLTAGDRSSEHTAECLERLCRTYWYPLYCFVRRKGYAPCEAEDLTQGFFARFLEKQYLKDVSPEKGRFRTFLLCSLNHFLANEGDKAKRIKRGGEMIFLPLETTNAEQRYDLDAQDAHTPELGFDRRWAQTILELVLRRLRSEFEMTGKSARFAELKPFLLGDAKADEYAAIARRLQMTEQGVKSAVHRLRQRFRELFREEIAHTVATRAEVDEELRYLVQLMT